MVDQLTTTAAMTASRSVSANAPSPNSSGCETDESAAPVVASLGRQVIHRMAEPEDIAGGILMLAGDDAGWITGQAILANGGNAFGL